MLNKVILISCEGHCSYSIFYNLNVNLQRDLFVRFFETIHSKPICRVKYTFIFIFKSSVDIPLFY